MSLFEQKNIGQHWGIFTQTASQLSIFVAMINLLLLITTAYNTTLSKWFEIYGIPLSFWTFMGLIILLLVIVAALLYKFALPSFFSVLNEQAYKHDNPIRADIEQVQKTLDANLKAISNRLEKLEKKKK